MKILNSYKAGWNISINSKRITTLVYLIYFVCALLLILPFYSLFNSIAGTSLLPDQLLNEFNATAFGEFLRDGGSAFKFYLKGIIPWLILFLLLGVFFQGGIISWISNPRGKFSSKMFFNKCVQYFWPFLKTTFYTLIIQIIFALLVYLPVSLLVGKENISDAYIGKTIIIGVSVHLILLIYGTMIADYTRFFIYRSGKRKVMKLLWRSIKFCSRRVLSLFGLYVLWLIAPLAIIVGFYLIRINWDVNSGIMILLLFVLQQVVIWLRTLLKIQKTSIFYRYLMAVSPNA